MPAIDSGLRRSDKHEKLITKFTCCLFLHYIGSAPAPAPPTVHISLTKGHTEKEHFFIYVTVDLNYIWQVIFLSSGICNRRMSTLYIGYSMKLCGRESQEPQETVHNLYRPLSQNSTDKKKKKNNHSNRQTPHPVITQVALAVFISPPAILWSFFPQEHVKSFDGFGYKTLNKHHLSILLKIFSCFLI